MSITLNIYYSGNGSNARQFAKEMMESGVVDEIRREDGNLRYEYFYPAEDAQTVLLVDSWTCQEAIDIHHHSPMMQKIIDLRNKYDLHMKVERYVSDSISDTDQKYIKK